MTNVDDYLFLISQKSNKFGDKLLKLMQMYDKTRLADITYEEAKKFYEKFVMMDE